MVSPSIFTDFLVPPQFKVSRVQTEECRVGLEEEEEGEGGGAGIQRQRGASCQPALLSHGQLVKANAGGPWRECRAAESANHGRALGIPRYSSP